MTQRELLGQIQDKVQQTQRRQFGTNFLHSLPVVLSLFLLAAAVIALVQTWFELQWPMEWIIGGLTAMALASALSYAFYRRPNATLAALSLDAAFDLRERVTTSMSLSGEQRDTPAGQALLDDTHQHLAKVKVKERFPLNVTARSWLSPVGAAGCVVLAMLFAPTPGMLQGQTEQAKDRALPPVIEPLELKAIKQSNEERRRRIQEVDSEKLAELQAEFDKLLAQIDPENQSAETQTSLMQMTRMEEMIRQRQEELSKSHEMRKQLQADASLKEADDGPTKSLQQALAMGDLNKAQEEAKKLLDKLKNKELSESEKKELEKKLGELAKKLEELAQQKQKKEAIEKSNADPETKQRELEKLQQEIAKLKDLQKLAEKMKQCQQCMNQGNMEGAQETLEDMLEELKNMNLDEFELKELQIAEEDLEDLKECMGGCKGCKNGKKGKGQCDSDGLLDEDRYTEGVEGATRGGRRKEEYSDTDAKDERLGPQYDPKGKIRVTGQGPVQPKPEKDGVGLTTLELSTELNEASQQASEALRQQKVAPSQRDLVTDFYKNLNPKTQSTQDPKKP